MEERYEPLKDLSVGNFGVAKLVRDKKTKELVAVKYKERGKKIDENVQRKIINHRSLRHPNIVRFKEDDDRACKFFRWLDTSICCTRGAAITPIVIAKFKRLEHAVEVANEELKQVHALTDATSEKE